MQASSPLSALARFGVIGLVLVATIGAFAYVGGAFTPERLSPDRFSDAFEHDNGLHAGFRRNHAKGVCVAGYFESSGQGARLSRALVFKPGRVPVIGRFALAGGDPHVADAVSTVRSLALRFVLPGGEEWRTGMNNIPVFIVNSAQAFYEQLAASRPDPATGRPDPAAMRAFFDRHPETVRAIEQIKAQPATAGFAEDTYNSLNAFRFVDAAGKETSVRWAMVPAATPEAAPPVAAAQHGDSYLFDDLVARIARAPQQWRLIVTIAAPSDATRDATIAWPPERTRVDVGTLTVDRIGTETARSCRDINFDPLVLPSGIAPSDDPLLSARSAVYANSFTRRAGEAKTPSAVMPSELLAGSKP
jgi:catalase